MVKPRRQAPDRKKFYVTLGAAALVGAAAIAYLTTGSGAAPITIDPTVSTGGPVDGYVLGTDSAPVEIIEYADFECPACGQFAVLTEPQVRERLVQTGMARFRFLDFPLPMHGNAVAAHLAAACAAEQGKFWEMHDQLFQAQTAWNTQATNNPKRVFARYAAAIGLDGRTWDDCYDERRPLARINASVAQGNRQGVGSTPTFIIGDQMVPGALGYDRIKALVDAAKARADSAAGRNPGE